jgi:hypothetical protein
VAESFLQADLEGARLTGEGYNQISDLIEPEFGQAWDRTVLTKNASIVSIRKAGKDKVVVAVEFNNTGIVDGDVLNVKNFREIIRLELKRNASSWRISGPLFPPHVKSTSLVSHYGRLLTLEKDRTDELNSLIKQLERLGR